MIEPRVIPADAVIFVDKVQALGGSGRELRDACRRGRLVRLHRGAYCPREMWDGADDRTRHTLRIHASVRHLRHPFLVAGGSAAALWGLPFAAGPDDEVTLLVPYVGGGSSEPGVRRTCVAFESAEPHALGGIPVTGYARTALDQARTLEFPRAVAVLDRAQWRRVELRVERSALQAELGRARYRRGSRALLRALEFSTSLSDSVGESECRAGIHLLGFEAPVLQKAFVDEQGTLETDYYWESVDVAGEFDGKVKYTRAEYTDGDPSAVVWREKQREDRLRRQVRSVLRLVSAEVRDRATLATRLDHAGIPRSTR